MKISYKVLKKYIPNIKLVEEVTQDLIMHTAEVEDIIYEGEAFNNIVYGKIQSIENHPDADSLKVCKVNVGEEENLQIVCGGSNLELNQAVAVAKLGAVVSWHGTETITMKKTSIRGVESFGMICASEEIGLKDEYPTNDPKAILDFGKLEAKPGTPLAELLKKDDAILEIDNKAINHRPDLFSHIGIIREIYTINNQKFDFDFQNKDFSNLEDLGIKNEIPEVVKRYIGLKIENVKNIETPDYIKQVLKSANINSKGLLIDISNYSLYLYGQPTHCFDADNISGNIIIRYAKKDENFIALNDVEYKLSENDIVIADSEKILALAGIIGGKQSSVTEKTTNIIVEGAHFDQATLRKTAKKLGIRTDSLNVFEKDILPEMSIRGVSLIASELEKNLNGIKISKYSDIYKDKQNQIEIDFDLDFINNLIGKKYEKDYVLNILNNLGIDEKNGKLYIPFWRKDLNFKADIAEEIARIDGYNNIDVTVPRINLGAVIQSNTYKIKNDSRNFFTDKGWFDLYTYSFVNKELMNKTLGDTNDLVPMKNALTEELTHLRGSLIPNLLLSLEKNIKDFDLMKLFEIEKVFKRDGNNINEYYSLSGVQTSDKDIVYYDIQNTISSFFKTVGILNYMYDTCKIIPSFAHPGRTASIIVRGKEVGTIGEIHPKVSENFEVNKKIGYFEINIEKIKDALYSITKAKEISNFQENNFDLNFVADKKIKSKDLKTTIAKTDTKLITKVELVDIYENEEKLPGKRSHTFKIFIQSMDGTLDDKVKNELINNIIKKVEKKGGELR
ncbi:phenylalanine--tRNA ligase subunit beta [Candidatus Gracilibacteria bacterium]|nr:phenylalanine--tRNA ligase subunit beta [Candidatus Gracilibacteria bacterium]